MGTDSTPPPSFHLEWSAEREQEVLAAVRGGHSARFAELVEAYQSRLFGTMLAMLGNRQDAEDVTQEAFARAFLKLNAFQEKSAFFTWLHRIAYHLAIDLRRKDSRQRLHQPLLNAEGDERLVSSEAIPSSSVDRNEAHQKIYQALALLDDERRMVITLRDLQGMDYHDIAQILEIPIGTVRSRLHRARLELRAILAPYFEGSADDKTTVQGVPT